MKDMTKESFGQFLSEKRQDKNLSLRGLARALDISAPFLSSVEKDRKAPFNYERIEQVARILILTDDEKTKLFDLAGQKSRSCIAPDLAEYINKHSYVKDALRTARNLGATKKDWLKFIDNLHRFKAAK